MRLKTCKCGWVYFGVTREYAEKEVKRFNKYFKTLSKQKQLDYYGGKQSSIIQYEYCGICGTSYKEFKRYKQGDCPNGVTLGPIIQKKD